MSNTNKNELVFDRVKADLTNGSWKGQYNASDLNRVEYWCRYLADKLNELGYSINITTKINWVSSDMRTDAEMERIRSNIQKLMTGFHWITKIYTYANTINYDRANRYEKILFEIYNMMQGMNNWYVYGGVANGGQPRLWQHRFRQFFKLPDIYTRLDYIESTGTQYIDTGFKPNNNTRLTMECQVTSITSDWAFLFGARDTYHSKEFSFAWNSSNWYTGFYNTDKRMTSPTRNTTTMYSIDKNKNVTNINSTSTTNTNGTFTCSYNLLLFGMKNGTAIYYGNAKIYSCQIYDNDTLVRNFIPVLRTIDNKPRII